MRAVGQELRVYLHRAPVDMRRGRNGLAALARQVMQVDPFSGAMFIYVGQRLDQTTFSIPIVFRHDRVSMAPVTRQEGWTVSSHGSTWCPSRPS